MCATNLLSRIKFSLRNFNGIFKNDDFNFGSNSEFELVYDFKGLDKSSFSNGDDGGVIATYDVALNDCTDLNWSVFVITDFELSLDEEYIGIGDMIKLINDDIL
jgi:hypothetical protein